MKQRDLTKGLVWKQILLYFLPLAVGTIFQQLYNAADGLIVSKFVGTIGLEAVGGSAAIVSSAIVNFLVSVTGGGSVLIAQYFGAGNKDAIKKSVHTSMLFSLICGIIMSIAGYLLTPSILRIMNTGEDCFEDAVGYLGVIFLGLVFQLVFNMGAGILRAVGDSKSPFKYLVICCLANIVLDYCAVRIMQMGVFGAAVATVISQGATAVLVTLKLIRVKGESYCLNVKELRIDWTVLRSILKIGLPLGLQSCMYSITNLLAQVALNGLGTLEVAAWALNSKLDGFFWGIMSAANTAVSNFIGQNYGKGDYGRMKKGIKASFVIFISVALFFAAITFTCAPAVLRYMSDDVPLRHLTYELFFYFVPFYTIWIFIEVFSGALRGEGKTLVSSIIIAITICVFRIAWIYTIFRIKPTIQILSICYPVSWTVCASVMTIYYINRNKKRDLV